MLMNFLMCSQVGPIGKLLSATGTPEGFLPRVRSHVSLQQPGPGESFPAHITLVAEAVGQDVHRQGWRAHIHLLTDRTGLGCLCGQLLVGLPVPGKVGTRSKVFATLITMILSLSVLAEQLDVQLGDGDV